MRRSIWLLLVLGAVIASTAAEIVVDCGRESLQTVIERAPPGAVITLKEGLCQENLVITKDITLRGAGADHSILRGAKPGFPVIFIESERPIAVTVEGLTLADAPKASHDPRHGKECARFYPELLCPSGLQVRGSARVLLRDARVLRNPWVGVYVLDTAQALVQQTEITENGWGVYISPQAAIQLEKSTVARQRENGVEIWGSAELRESVIRESGRAGVEIFGEAKLFANSISENRQAGVLLSGSAQAELVKNIMTNNSWGIAARLRQCGYLSDEFRGAVRLEENRVFNNRLGNICLP